MRHGKKFNHLGRKAAHRKAMLSNMACSLIDHKRINTTVAKAKALKRYVEPLITKAKNDSTHSRRVVFSYLRQKETIKELFGAVSSKVGDRPGGYTRILKCGHRAGDAAPMAFVELVDRPIVDADELDADYLEAQEEAQGAAQGASQEETQEAAAEAEAVEETTAEADVSSEESADPAAEDDKK